MEKSQRELMKKLFLIAIPIALQNLINVGVSVTDTLMIGNINELQLAGISQANQPYFIFTTLIFGLASGSMVLNAQYWGNGDKDSIRAIMGLIMRIGVVAGALVAILVISFPNKVLSIFTNEAMVINYGAEYIKIVGLSYVFSAFTGVYLMGLRSIEDVKTSMYIYGMSFVLNVILNYILIFGHFGAPRLEIRGAALATLISRIFESLLVLIYMYNFEKNLGYTLKDLFHKTSMYWKKITRYSLPVLFSEINWGLGISVQAAIIGHLGANVIAANSFINVFQQLVSIAIIGIGAGSSIIIGNLIGKGKESEKEVLKFSKLLVKISILIGAVIVCLTMLIRPIAPSFINASQETAKLIKDMMYVSAFLLFFQSITIVTLAGVLRGGGDTIFCAINDVITLWFLKIGLGTLCAFVLKLNPVLVYLILSSDEFFKALVTLPRLWKGKWIHYTTVSNEV
ncbi:putative efflux protein, MATE family [Clostridium collagenovorans DSM 3089]|uniref:Putative efflux protein, MATE family n=1 Tax=Clostridium collagenovorans DSM 3089 TaxID=1121306 RepID=A0A1M5Y2J0_9CLOT|nr:MATE family efflux transporter [Clostridium collagenovorans]SHI06186.1 putative efflux protein, MATE family [Clostridium collagenovorans DSM 3089]